MEFTIIVATDKNRGIGYKNTIPWNNPKDKKFFREKTKGGVVIMGRKTYESIGKELPYRKNFILSKTLLGRNIFTSLNDALLHCKKNKLQNIFVIGGQQVYEEAINHPLCTYIYHTIIPGHYKCDTFFPDIPKGFKCISNKQIREYKYINEEEKQYLDIFKKFLRQPLHSNRTQARTRSLFATSLSFSLLDNTLPLLTTKRVNFNTICEELLFFLKGKRNTKILEDKGINIWKGNTTKEFIQSRGLDYEEGDMGPLYGVQWRNWDSIDQIETVISSLKSNPFSRRHVVSAWNVTDLSKGVLEPCHAFFQFVVTPNKEGKPTYLSCMLHQRSGDYFLGIPFNIASYSLLTHMIAKQTGLVAREFKINIADCHLYENHEEQVITQMFRQTRKFSQIQVKDVDSIDDYTSSSFEIINYFPQSYIKAPMAV